jgi:hypothetical protein
MPIQTKRNVGPAVQPARCRTFTPDRLGSALMQKPGWWCDGRGMLWENYKVEGKTANDRLVSEHPGPLWGSRAVHTSFA